MGVTTKPLFQAKDAEATQTTQYTARGVTTIIDKFTATNHSGAAVSIVVNIIPSGGSVTNSNITVIRTIPANATYTFPELVGQVLSSGDFIGTIASAATSLSIRASGREIT